MLLIPCPWCGARSQLEFTYGGDATVGRPKPDAEPLNAFQRLLKPFAGGFLFWSMADFAAGLMYSKR